MNTIHVDVVSAEESIFSGEARFVALPGESGELVFVVNYFRLPKDKMVDTFSVCF